VAHHLYLALSHFFARYGYWTIFGAVVAENTGVPAPGDTIVLFAGFVAHRGGLSLTWTILAAFLSAVLGQCLGFAIGHWGGKALIERHGRKLLISEKHYQRSQAIFLNNAGWAIFIARYVVGLREVAGLLSGVFRMRLSSFLIPNIAGAALWSVSMSCIGYYLSHSWRRLLEFFSRMDLAALAVFGVVVLILALRQWRRRAKPDGTK
jgi:membrane protein DedA with SNARE-associated domain